MFDLPDAKRVRREDLFSSPSSSRASSPTPGSDTAKTETEAALSARLARLISLALPPLPNDDNVPMPDAQEDKEEEEFEFRLFSTSAPTQHVNLAEEVHQGPAISQRPVEFYVRGALTEEEKARFRAAAVSGEEVVRGARGRAWGLEVPWRVGEAKVEGEAKGRKRPGKKRRIALRIKVKAAKEAEAKKMSKEEHLKEKKKRLNREKKLKRRQKEKEKKMAAGQGGEEGDVSSDDGSG
ncbi:hypothetical protein B0T18DRAFT_426868 [Schizothecium vesticola]|uniref:Uncharacterized protein n=1 Tax=Schizothecium vesticola TaxID=314040 RepID=A0AA40F734_9PEZI|nr:hypothetical protein B0T18DRAFT_426868 [Schizothecium vesticola]